MYYTVMMFEVLVVVVAVGLIAFVVIKAKSTQKSRAQRERSSGDRA